MNWLAQFFLHPAFVIPGAALVASPIIIHFINRLRYRRVHFAAMEFLFESQQKNRRRLLIEQLILLLLRILIVLIITMLIARLVLDPAQISLFRGARTHHVVIVDDSASMREELGEGTAFDAALDVVTRLVEEGSDRPNTQKITIIRLSDLDNRVVSEANINESLLEQLRTRLETLECTHQSLDVLDGLETAREILDNDDDATLKHIHVISDFRQSEWVDQKAIGQTVRELDESDIAVNLVKTVGKQNDNLAVTEFSGELQVAVAGVPMTLHVAVTNFGQTTAEDVRVNVLVDDVRLPVSILFDEIEPGVNNAVHRDLFITVNAPGKHRLEVRLDHDALPADNARYLAIDLANANQVLIVDGDPEASAGEYIADALAADPQLTGFAPRIVSPEYVRKNPLSEFQCIYMVNVPVEELPVDAIEPLARYVEQGGGLAWFVGDQVNPGMYNEKLYREKNGLFPVPLAPARLELEHDDLAEPGPDLVFQPHPVFEVFEGEENPFIAAVRVDEYLPVTDDWERDDNRRQDGVATLATLKNRSPVLFERSYGAGTIVACLTTAGPDWNNWARNPSFVIFQLELEKHIAMGDRTLDRREVGEPIRFSLDPSQYSEDVRVTAPGEQGERILNLTADLETKPKPKNTDESDENRVIGVTSDDESSRSRYSAEFGDTDYPGVYRVRLTPHSGDAEEQWMAYNAAVGESDLRLSENNDLLERIGEGTSVQIQDPGNFSWMETKEAGQEIRRWVLIALVLLLLLEQLLAYIFSYHPKKAVAVPRPA